jgi:hypothetical protein
MRRRAGRAGNGSGGEAVGVGVGVGGLGVGLAGGQRRRRGRGASQSHFSLGDGRLLLLGERGRAELNYGAGEERRGREREPVKRRNGGRGAPTLGGARPEPPPGALCCG